MRILTWNINGIRTLPLYHPWNTLKTGDNILHELNADIICFQEMKSSRQAVERHIGLPDSYDAFFSFPTTKVGYSGVGVYTKTSSVMPLKAEEGLSGRLASGLKPSLSVDERVSPSYPLAHEMDLMGDEAGNTPNDLLELDKEGRALVLDFGLFVLINLYCPNETSDARLPYKMNFHFLLGERVRRLIDVEKREVIVVGDINICADPIDHCDGELASNKEEFWVHPARSWFHEWLDPRGPMVDVVRRCWPGRKGMFTCWNTKIDARVSNYGTRIDYILFSKGLLPWFKHGDIQPFIKGSDHCPVYVDLYDEIVTDDGQKLTLKEAMKIDKPNREPPRIASKFWSEYSGKQKLLSSFFGKKVDFSSAPDSTPNMDLITTATSEVVQDEAAEPTQHESASGNPATSHLEIAFASAAENLDVISSILSDKSARSPSEGDRSPVGSPNLSSPAPLPVPAKPLTTTATTATIASTSQSTTTETAKRKKSQADSNYPAQSTKKLKKDVRTANSSSKGSASTKKAKSQLKLSAFFAGPSSSQPSATQSNADSHAGRATTALSECIDVDALLENEDNDSSRPSESQISEAIPVPSSSPREGSTNGNGTNKTGHSWSTLFARVEPPKCIVHGEPAREFTVNKPGPNKGKTFYICSRPVGPGYDKGRDKRLREEVDHRYKCNYFKWSSEVKRAALQEAQKKGDLSKGR